jgi:tetratricopeptide (TPR) repeat protein
MFVERELVEPVRDPRSPRRGGFRFVQELMREVARNRMSREVRKARHIAAARYVESLGGPDDAVVAADHYLSGLAVTSPGPEADALRRQAADVLASALERAATLYANEEVLSLGARILDLDLDLPLGQLAAINEQMAAAASALLRLEDAQSYAESALALSRRLGDQTGVRRGAALCALINLENFQTRPALEVIEQQLEGIDDLSDDPELARLEGLRARARFLEGDFEGSLFAADRALLAAEELQLVPVVGDALVTKATIFGIQGRLLESRLLLESVIQLAERENLSNLALRAYLNLGAVIPEDALAGDPTLKAIELARRVGNLNFTLAAWSNRAAYLITRAEWDQAEELLADPLWLSATGEHHVTRLIILAMKASLQGHTADAKATLREALDVVADEPEHGPVFTGNAEAWAANIHVLTDDTAAALDWAQGVLERPESIPWISPLAQVLLLAGDRRQVEDLAAVTLVRRQTTDLRHGPFVRSVVAVQADDALALAASEELIIDAALNGSVLIEAIWTIGLARWLPEGHPDRLRLMNGVRERIDRHGFAGLARFVDS